MNKLSTLAVILASVAFSPLASADNQTVTLGYAQSKVQDFKDIKGVNLKYRYEWDSPYSIIGSFTYMSGKQNHSEQDELDSWEFNDKLNYYSLSVGPAYRFNDYISIYGLVGLNYNKAESTTRGYLGDAAGNREELSNVHYSAKKTAFMYGVGLQINPTPNWAVDVGYEGSRFNGDERHLAINGFNVAVGYRF